MIKAAFIGLVAAAAAIAAEMGTDHILALRQAWTAAAVERTTEARKTHEINVPRIKDGAVKGYAVMQLSYTVELKALRTASMAPDSILVDEAFRYVYNDDTIDFDHLDRFDLAKMSDRPGGQRASGGRGRRRRRRAGVHLRLEQRHARASVKLSRPRRLWVL